MTGFLPRPVADDVHWWGESLPPELRVGDRWNGQRVISIDVTDAGTTIVNFAEPGWSREQVLGALLIEAAFERAIPPGLANDRDANGLPWEDGPDEWTFDVGDDQGRKSSGETLC